jgi:hypothetical protein
MAALTRGKSDVHFYCLFPGRSFAGAIDQEARPSHRTTSRRIAPSLPVGNNQFFNRRVKKVEPATAE